MISLEEVKKYLPQFYKNKRWCISLYVLGNKLKKIANKKMQRMQKAAPLIKPLEYKERVNNGKTKHI